jgi:hypothetical protein
LVDRSFAMVTAFAPIKDDRQNADTYSR